MKIGQLYEQLVNESQDVQLDKIIQMLLSEDEGASGAVAVEMLKAFGYYNAKEIKQMMSLGKWLKKHAMVASYSDHRTYGFRGNEYQCLAGVLTNTYVDVRGFDVLHRHIGMLRNVEHLHIQGQKGSNPKPIKIQDSFGNLKKLRILSFIKCNLQEVPQQFAELKSLESLTIHYCKVSKVGALIDVVQLPNIKELQVSRNWIEDKDFEIDGWYFPFWLDRVSSSLKSVTHTWSNIHSVPEIDGLVSNFSGSLNLGRNFDNPRSGLTLRNNKEEILRRLKKIFPKAKDISI